MKKLLSIIVIVLFCAVGVHGADIERSTHYIYNGVFSGGTIDGATIVGYKTLYIPAASMTPCATNGPDVSTYEYATNDVNVDYMAFDATTKEFADFQIPMPEGWNRSTIKAKFLWTSATGSTADDTVEWQLAGQAISDSDPLDVALGDAGEVISDVLLADNGTDLQISGATPAITIGGTPALGDLISFKVSRNVGGTDDMAEDAWLIGVWIQYKETNAVTAW